MTPDARLHHALRAFSCMAALLVAGVGALAADVAPVTVKDTGGRVVLANGLVEVEIRPAGGMYVPYVKDLTTGATVCNELKLNFPYFEHGIKDSQPSGYRVIRHRDGSVTVAMAMRFGHHKGPKETQRYGRFAERSLSEFVTVAPGTARVAFGGRVDNPTPLPRSHRLWDRTLMPVPEDRAMRFLFPARYGVEHSANWIKPWPHWEFEGRMLDVSKAGDWGEGRPTQYFALYPAFGFSGACYPDQDLNRLRINDPEVDPGIKVYMSRGGRTFELWGGTTTVFEDPGHLLPGYVPVEYTKHFYAASGIGPAVWAGRDVALGAERPDAGGWELAITGPTPMDDVHLLASCGDKDLGHVQGPVGPGKVLRLSVTEPSEMLHVTVQRQEMDPVQLLDGSTVTTGRVETFADVTLPLALPDNRDRYEEAKAACNRSRFDYIELQEHSNHRGIEAAMTARRQAKRLLEAESGSASVPALVSAAAASYRIGDFDEAGRLVDRVLAREPEQPRGWHLKGLIAYEQGRTDDAEAALAKAGPRAGHVRALMALAAGKPKEALKRAETLIEAEPRVYRPRMLKAWLLAKTGNAAEAAEAAERLLRENPASPEAAETLHRCAKAAGKDDLAKEAAAARDALVKDNPDAARQLGLFGAELDTGRWAYTGRYAHELPQP